MFVVDGKLITPSEDSDTILKSVTKRSVVEITRHWGLDVEERKITVSEIVAALKEGRVSEAFGAGTAATIAPISKIGFRGELFEIPAVETREISNRVSRYFTELRAGKIEDEMKWLVPVKEFEHYS